MKASEGDHVSLNPRINRRLCLQHGTPAFVMHPIAAAQLFPHKRFISSNHLPLVINQKQLQSNTQRMRRVFSSVLQAKAASRLVCPAVVPLIHKDTSVKFSCSPIHTQAIAPIHRTLIPDTHEGPYTQTEIHHSINKRYCNRFIGSPDSLRIIIDQVFASIPLRKDNLYTAESFCDGFHYQSSPHFISQLMLSRTKICLHRQVWHFEEQHNFSYCIQKQSI